jgi:hypothetical protein
MKITCDQRRLMGRRLAAARPVSAFRATERGIALVITLILLSITLVMAIAFMALSKRERNAVTTTTDTAIARQAADSALAQAQNRVMANLLAAPGGANSFGLLVSTNYINGYGFVTGLANPTNVNYDRLSTGGQLATAGEWNQNIANLWFLPRAPVFVVTNHFTGSNEFRFYIDLNRNGRFDGNGMQAEYDNFGAYVTNVMTHSVSNFMTGDPEWIGVLERPDTPHGPNNKFIARYAYFAVPSGNTLDVNFIHNQAHDRTLDKANDVYFRNQGVGSWEINLAAFLADLNTNEWAAKLLPDNGYYAYNMPNNNNFNQGVAFNDALALLSYRYNHSYSTLSTADSLFNFLPTKASVIFPFDGVDAYTDGGLQTSLNTNADFVFADPTGKPWVGSDNPNRFFSISEFFDKNKTQYGITGMGFTDRLMDAGRTNLSTYDHYTFYRMLSQLGTDSTAEEGKLNLNYRNVANGVVVPGLETNLAAWEAVEFFTNAADRMLRTYTTNWFQRNPSNYLVTYYGVIPRGRLEASGLGVTNLQYYGQTNQIPAFGINRIPVLVNSNFVYSPAVNRLLQLAANLYDAKSTNFYPSVFRPVFWKTNENGYNNIYVCDYVDVSRYSQQGNTMIPGTQPLDPPLDITDPALVPMALLNQKYGNAYGVPWIIGAKKGFPNFNQLAMVNSAQVVRKLQISQTTNSGSATRTTNQMYVMSITNNFGLSFWNSYNADYVPRSGSVRVYAFDRMDMQLTNPVVVYPLGGSPAINITYFDYTTSVWPGSRWNASGHIPPQGTAVPSSFIFTNWSYPFMANAIYRFGTPGFEFTDSSTAAWETTSPSLPELPQFGLMTTNRLQAMILDGNNVIDYVQLRGPTKVRGLNSELADPDYPDSTGTHYQWSTNLAGSSTINYGVLNQIAVSQDPSLAPKGNTWKKSPTMPASVGATPQEEAAFFRGFLLPNFQYGGITYSNMALVVQAPYTPTRLTYDYTLWQANDPLVHYLASDLNYYDPSTVGLHHSDDASLQPVPTTTKFMHAQGDRYQPWGVSKQMQGLSSVDTNACNLAYKDPLVWSSDSWDFPTNVFPSVGWIGRVHRGTPWQTVFLKSPNVLKMTSEVLNTGTVYTGTNTWFQWTGDTQQAYGQYFDAANMAPLEDRVLFDLFTARLNANAVRGTLSVNQDQLAAWSAVLSGLVTVSNGVTSSVGLPSPSYTAAPGIRTNLINPAGVAKEGTPLWQIFTNINAMRASFPNKAFGHVGDVLSASALTDKSPFLNLSTMRQLNNGINDEMYEWLPQQVLGLLRCPVDPRYTIYCYGQTLHPTSDGMVQSGPFAGLIANYQVVAESATRAVIQVHSQVSIQNGRSVTNYTISLGNFNPLPPD